MSDSLPFEEHILASNTASERLDKWLQNTYPKLSRTYFQKLIEEGFVTLNGKKAKKRLLLKEKDHIRVSFALNEEITLKPQDIPLDILYEDSHLLAINKPAGLVVHPAPGNWENTLVNGLLYYLNLPQELPTLRPGIVHRLDKDTSGVLLTAKSDEAHRALTQLFAERQIEKTYLAITHNNPGVCKVQAPIARHPQRRKEMTVSAKGKSAETFIKTLAYNDKYSLVQAKPKTGRTHQIRVHLKHLRCPVVGDTLYGPQTPATSRQLLHASALYLQHPLTQSPLLLKAPLPEDFLAFQKQQQLSGEAKL